MGAGKISAGVGFVCVGCEAAMKNDEEFIAGIYRKAEEKRKEEKNARRGHPVRVWQPLAAAACLCIIVSGLVYAGSRKETPRKDPVSGEGAVMALSVENMGMPTADGEKNARARTSGEERKQEKSSILDGLWAGYDFSGFVMGQFSAADEGIKTQGAGGN